MNLVKCSSGHFYDSESFGSCPHCSAGPVGDSNVTVPLQASGNDEVTVALSHDSNPTVPLSAAEQQAVAPIPISVPSLQDAVSAAVSEPPSAIPIDNDNKTVGFFSSAIGKEPVVGWLVCSSGEHFGEDFRLKSGRNFIGRASNMDVCITKDNTVSRERHAIIVYEPRGNLFLVQPGDSKELCYLNDSVVLSPQPINVHDRLLVGKTELMFIPCCTERFNWEMSKG